MSALRDHMVFAALSTGKVTLIVISAVLAVVIFAFRWKYAPPWWLRRHRDHAQPLHRTNEGRQPPSARPRRGPDDGDHD